MQLAFYIGDLDADHLILISRQKALEEAMERGHIECIQVILQWEPDIVS